MLRGRRARGGALNDDIRHTATVFLVDAIVFEHRIGVFRNDVPCVDEAGNLNERLVVASRVRE